MFSSSLTAGQLSLSLLRSFSASSVDGMKIWYRHRKKKSKKKKNYKERIPEQVSKKEELGNWFLLLNHGDSSLQHRRLLLHLLQCRMFPTNAYTFRFYLLSPPTIFPTAFSSRLYTTFQRWRRQLYHPHPHPHHHHLRNEEEEEEEESYFGVQRARSSQQQQLSRRAEEEGCWFPWFRV